ncbi:FliO/MopB family protein [Actinoplanes teichomyceticus]|uniref:Flagellar protein FliO/FliZ n=1 Tax=Actinoplanes teichomyceticus TaxID=1867 RepID=A0A561WQ55_ACTTI|nr:flagellar biosynthetic protein FliO [Actinoplanes teichomyceticus]TWG25989.1 flagellar protein FliO/FliZ [Actinoplanes teichomyceticus]GIF11064.1 hypothetical protein Ate01nite_10960 [Actinoplanes teichomyceticus]
MRLLLQVAFSLFVVLFMMWGLARALRRPFGGRGYGTLTVLNRQQLSRSSAVAVVRVADRALVLGVTDQQISYLGETELEAFETEPEHRDPVVVERSELIEPDMILPGRHPAAEAGAGPGDHHHRTGRLAGSLLSPRTWSSTLEFLRDRTTRR